MIKLLSSFVYNLYNVFFFLPCDILDWITKKFALHLRRDHCQLHYYPLSISIMLTLPILSFHLSRCQRQISECSNDSLEILVFNYDDVVDDDDYNKDDIYEVDYSLNNYRAVHRSCGSTVDSDEINLNAGNGNGKKSKL